METTKVKFRILENAVIAIFPEINEGNGRVQSYMHLGQHAPASYPGILYITRYATPEQYAPLKEELESIGYNLEII